MLRESSSLSLKEVMGLHNKTGKTDIKRQKLNDRIFIDITNYLKLKNILNTNCYTSKSSRSFMENSHKVILLLCI